MTVTTALPHPRLHGSLLLAVLSLLGASVPLAACAHGQAPSQATSPTTSQAFLDTLYMPYKQGKAQETAPARTKALYSADLATLIERDRAEAQGEVGVLDYDPICNCQDFDKLADVRVADVHEAGDTASANVSFRNGAASETIAYRLKREGGSWHIDDICPAKGSCLKAMLTAG